MNTQNALEGLRILDLTRYEAGPTCTLLLAFMGAEVIKLECPRRGAAMRRVFHERGNKEDLYFVLLNLNKKSVCLDLETDSGQRIFRQLIAHADVLVENAGSEKLRCWGLAPDQLDGLNPRLILASVSGYGSYGPYAGYPALDMTAQAMGGMMSITGERDDAPLRCGATVADSAGGANLALGIMAALFRREKTGRGSRIEVSLQDSVLNLGRSLLGSHIAYGSKAPRMGNSLKDVVPWNVYPARDGHVAICVISQRLFRRLAVVLDQEAVFDGLGIRSIEDRAKHRKTIDKAIASWTAPLPRSEILERLAAEGIPCGPVLDSMEIARDPHLLERETVVEVDHPQWGRIKVLGSPVKFMGEKVPVTCCPRLGEHTLEVLRSWLNTSEDEINDLYGQGTIGPDAEDINVEPGINLKNIKKLLA